MITGRILSLGILGLAIFGANSIIAGEIDTPTTVTGLPGDSRSGVVELRYFNGVAVSSIEAMKKLSRYPSTPDEIVDLNRLEVLESRASTYGSLVRGFIVPKVTGTYRFFVSGDDEVQFVFSNSSSSSGARVIASVPRYSRRNQFNKYNSQKSDVVDLKAGERYYFEVLHREEYGADHFSVAWEGPGFERSVIDGEFLASLGAKGENQDALYGEWAASYNLDVSDPNSADSDQDGDLLSAFEEFQLDTDPTTPDTDGDEIPDGEEVAFGLNPLDPADASFDADGDGFTNLEESRAGTDMTDSEDNPKLETGLLPGVMGQYFTGNDFNEFLFTRAETGLSFDWGRGSPSEAIPNSNFTARWTGYFVPAHASGTRDYKFQIKRDDGARLYVNGSLEFDTWNGSVWPVYTHTVSLPAGRPIPFALEYKEDYGSARISVKVVDVVTGETQRPEDFYRTDPLNSDLIADTDDDGIPDAWETRHGLNPSSMDASASNNRDGISNLQAYQSGLSPWTLEMVSSPSMPGVTPPSNGGDSSITPPFIAATSMTVAWTAPLTRVSGASISLSEIAGYRIRYGRSKDDLDNLVDVSSENTSYTFKKLEKGEWYFNVQTVDQKGLHSRPSETLSHVLGKQ